jgi:hypothetical protein
MISMKTVDAPANAIEMLPDPVGVEPTFEARWAAWQARGAEHELRVRRTFFMLAPLIAMIGVTIYVLIRMW